MSSFQHISRAAAAFAAACLMMPTASSAAPRAEKVERAAILKALADCRAITDSNERLACFDKTSGDFVQAEASGAVVVLDQKQVREARRQAFGFDLAALNFFNRGLSTKEADQLTEVLASASQGPNGFWIVTLESGATWREIDGEAMGRDPHPGSKVVIMRGAVGSFVMKIDGQQAIRVRRVQ
jgi:hypothetical protein